MMTDGSTRRILIITAHPDDADVHAGGTIARWVDEGHHALRPGPGHTLAERFKRLLPT
jgi:hypothetical protein